MLGLAAAESTQRHALEKQIQPIMAQLVLFFFVVTGARVELAALVTPSALLMLLVVTVPAVIGKLVGCGLGAWSLGHRSALIVGVGMVPRGEVGIIVASLGQQAGVFSGSVYAIIIAMSLLTSVLAPPLLKSLLAGLPPLSPSDADEESDPSYLYEVEETGHGWPRERPRSAD